MKLLIKIFPVFIFALFFLSCQKNQPSKKPTIKTIDKTLMVENLNHLKVEIKGMTCEIGCARLIQSKLYKADGITFAKVSFADSSGLISYDKNRISEEEVKEIIQNTAGGDIYTVSAMQEIDDPEVIGEQE